MMMKVGDRVQAIRGQYEGYKGFVVAVPNREKRIVRFHSKRGDVIERLIPVAKLKEVRGA